MGVPSRSLSRNRLGPEGAAALAPGIAANGSLTSVRAAPITKAFPLDQVTAMFANPHALCVSQLNLADNHIRAEGVEPLAKALGVNGGLTTVWSRPMNPAPMSHIAA